MTILLAQSWFRNNQLGRRDQPQPWWLELFLVFTKQRKRKQGKQKSQPWWLGLLLVLTLFGCSTKPAADLEGPRPDPESDKIAFNPETHPNISFVFWNVENFFDDQLNHHNGTADAPYDRMFSQNSELFQVKLDHLAQVLLHENEGLGPDMLGLAEVETGSRSVEALRDRLNKSLPPQATKYQHIQQKDPEGGRAIMTAVLSRIPLTGFRTQLWGKRLRILKTEVANPLGRNKAPLILVVSHWTSRVSDKEGSGRAKYADQIQGQVRAILLANPAADLMVCGDFNDDPHEPSVRDHLKALPSSQELLSQNPQMGSLFNLFGSFRHGQPGTHYYSGSWYQFDQIAVSPGMLDQKGWGVVPESQHILRYPPNLNKKGHPLAFGSEKHKGARGVSDHLPVGVKLRILPD